MRHPGSILTTICTLVLFAAPADAQEEYPWRARVDVLVDRWSNDVGSSRVEVGSLAPERNTRFGFTEGKQLTCQCTLHERRIHCEVTLVRCGMEISRPPPSAHVVLFNCGMIDAPVRPPGYTATQ